MRQSLQGEKNLGEIKPFVREKLIMGVIINEDKLNLDVVTPFLEKEFGEVDYKSNCIDFNFTEYYQDEMGSCLKRYFLSFKNLVDPIKLADIKIFSNELEIKLSGNSDKRIVNIDPGIISLGNLILASTKNFSHRIPLSKGIYAEITLVYVKGWQHLQWTFPDYRTEQYQKVFSEIRTLLYNQRKTQS